MSRRELEGVRPGDKLKVMHSWGAQYREYTVVRVTKTQAVCACDAAFKIDSGLMIGTADWRNPTYATFLTDEDKARAALDMRINEARKKFACIRITADNLDAAEAFIAASSNQ